MHVNQLLLTIFYVFINKFYYLYIYIYFFFTFLFLVCAINIYNNVNDVGELILFSWKIVMSCLFNFGSLRTS